MARIPDRKFTEKELLQRLKNGNKCMGIKKSDVIAAFSWCDPKEVSFQWHRMPLKNHEAYMYDLYTLVEFRGKNLAPFFSYIFYKELEKRGLTTLYSYVDYFNTPSMNFKREFNAQKVKLDLYVVILKKWIFHFTVKNYQK